MVKAEDSVEKTLDQKIAEAVVDADFSKIVDLGTELFENSGVMVRLSILNFMLSADGHYQQLPHPVAKTSKATTVEARCGGVQCKAVAGLPPVLTWRPIPKISLPSKDLDEQQEEVDPLAEYVKCLADECEPFFRTVEKLIDTIWGLEFKMGLKMIFVRVNRQKTLRKILQAAIRVCKVAILGSIVDPAVCKALACYMSVKIKELCIRSRLTACVCRG